MIIQCPECQKEISDQAKSCPNCGYPIKPRFVGLKAFGWVLLALLVWYTAESLFALLASNIIIPFFSNVFNMGSTVGVIICFIVILGISCFGSWWITLLSSYFFTRTKGQGIACGIVTVSICVLMLILNPKSPYSWGLLIASIGWFLLASRDHLEDFVPSRGIVIFVVLLCLASLTLEFYVGYKLREKYVMESIAAYETEIEKEIVENDISYIVNTSSNIFHKPDCVYAPEPTSESFYLSHKPYGELIKQYKPCEHCL